MKNILLAAMFAGGVCAAVEAAPTDAVTQADLQALIQRISKLEAENKAQAAKIAELEGKAKVAPAAVAGAQSVKDGKVVACDKTSEISESGKVVTTASGKKYFLADATANIFEPLSESGLQITPYGYLVFEGTYSTRGLYCDWSTDFVAPKGDGRYRNTHNSTLTMQDSILGVQFMTPEAVNGWKFSGKVEFDLVDTQYGSGDADDYGFHWRHIYVDAAHESGWSILFGQTWHLWKMVTPSEIDGAWMENTGHPYRRSPQIRVTKKWELDEDSSFEMRVGFLKNGPNASTERDGDGALDSTSSAWGWFEAAAIYDHKAAWEDGDRRWLVGLGGMYGRDASRRLSYDSNGEPIVGPDGYVFGGESDDYNSQMVMLAGSIPFLEKFTLCGQVFAGENLGRVQAGCGQSVSYDFDAPALKGDEVKTVGGFIDLTYTLNDDWDFAIGYGFDDPSIASGTYVVNAANIQQGITFNDRAYIAAFYHITSNFKLGLEFAELTTKYENTQAYGFNDGGASSAERIQFSAFYDF